MPIFLDPTGRSTYGIAICARCKQKFFLDELFEDPNSPGLKVCLADRDDYDPYRLPPRVSEDISLRFCRPDEPLTIDDEGVAAETYFLLAENNDPLETEASDNLILEEAP